MQEQWMRWEPTGERYDGKGHPKQNDPKAQKPHAHRIDENGNPVLDETGNPHLPVNGSPNKKDSLMRCFLCSNELEVGCLCKTHAEELKRILDMKINLIEKPEWKHHCSLCGEYERRKMVEYKSYAYFCDKDILEEWENYHKFPKKCK